MAGLNKGTLYLESLLVSVIQATGVVEFEDGLCLWESANGLKIACGGSALYLGF